MKQLKPEKVSHALASAAKTVWQWISLVVGGRPGSNDESVQVQTIATHCNSVIQGKLTTTNVNTTRMNAYIYQSETFEVNALNKH